MIYVVRSGSAGANYVQVDFGRRTQRVDVCVSGKAVLRGKYSADSDYEDEMVILPGRVISLPLCAESVLIRSYDGSSIDYVLIGWTLLTKEGE